jgi:acyl carrier protein
MNTPRSIEDRVKTIFAYHLGFPVLAVKNESNVHTELDADSLDIVSILIDIEREFGVEIPDEVGFEFKTVQEFIDHVTENAK